MEFRSSYEQNLEALCGIKSELISQRGKYHTLHQCLIGVDTTEYRIEEVLRMSVGACVSSLLAQLQTSLFLGMLSCTPGFRRGASSALTSSRL